MDRRLIKYILPTAAFVLTLLFFTTLPALSPFAFSATTTDAINITITVDEAAAPPAPPGTGGGGPIGTPATVQIIDVDITVATDTATILWETNKPAISTLAWGTTTEYTLGTLSEIDLATLHSATLPGLTPDTEYLFFIEVDDLQVSRQGYAGTFRTLSLPDIEPPANVSNFVAQGTETSVDLSWENPPDEDFDLVRIVRSDTFFPLTPFEGVVVYEGRGAETRDRDVEEGITYYYSAFALDESGNPSEGSIASGRLVPPGVPPLIIPKPIEEFPPAPPDEVPPLLQILKLLHIDFIQDGKKIPYSGNRVPINGAKDLTVSIDYDRLPEILKTIALTFTDPEDSQKTFSFLLRVTPDKTTYRTTLAPLKRGGTYDFDVNILDHKNQAVKKLNGELLVAAVIEEVEAVEMFGTYLADLLRQNICLLLLLLVLLLLLSITYMRFFRKVGGRKLYLFLFILLAVIIVAALILFRVRIGEQGFCLLLFLIIFFLLLYSTYKLSKRILTKRIT